MPSRERRFTVWLNDQMTGVLHARDDYTWFTLDPAYVSDPQRAVLGLRFEQDLKARHSANMRLPPWFSNLLPEGKLRRWIAEEQGVSVDREMELLTRIGHDLPGAVQIEATDARALSENTREVKASPRAQASRRWRFSLAGVQLKFSMLAAGDRFTAPATGEHGDWIVKLPDTVFSHVPSNERAMMELARRAGIDVPETKLVHRDSLEEIPTQLWPGGEAHAFAIRRFDRTPERERVHMEDLAQVRGYYPQDKYKGSFETLANLIYRTRDADSLLEAVRRLAFNVLIRNGDAHLKNWSLLYRNPRVPELSPAYDLVSTAAYGAVDSDLGLRLLGSKRFDRISLHTFAALQSSLAAKNGSLDGIEPDAFLQEAQQVVERALAAWPAIRDTVPGELAKQLDPILRESGALLRRTHR